MRIAPALAAILAALATRLARDRRARVMTVAGGRRLLGWRRGRTCAAGSLLRLLLWLVGCIPAALAARMPSRAPDLLKLRLGSNRGACG